MVGYELFDKVRAYEESRYQQQVVYQQQRFKIYLACKRIVCQI